MADILRLTPGQLWQGTDEDISYTIAMANWVSSIDAASVAIYENGTDRSGSNLSSGACDGASVSGTTVTTPCVLALTANTDYVVAACVWESGERKEAYFIVTGVNIGA